MALTDDGGNGMVMPVSPMGNGYGFGSNGFDGDGWWIILLFLLLAGNNGWGNGFGGGNSAPYMVDNSVQRGFDQSAIMNGITGLNNGLTDIQQSICNGFSSAEIADNARQIANMQTAFNSQVAITNGLNDVNNSLQNCCCENRAGIADLKYTVATEACADRSAISEALRDVIEANTASTQRILDTMCQDKIDAKNEKIAELQNQLTMANLAASQNLQTQTLLTDNLAQTNALEQYLAPVPRPAYVVQNPNCCTANNGCGCGINGF